MGLNVTRVAIIGAGMSGLACGTTLARAGAKVSIFDKARGPGGRVSTRRSPIGSFDHGAPFFSVDDPGFADTVARWAQLGVAALWQGEPSKTAARYIFTPGMNAAAKTMAAEVDVTLTTKIAPLSINNSRTCWNLTSDGGEAVSEADWVVSSAPAPQTAQLLAATGSPLVASADAAMMRAAWTVMVGFDATVTPSSTPVLTFEDHPILDIAIAEAAKPSREQSQRWVVHPTQKWSDEHLEADPKEVSGIILRAFQDALGGENRPMPAHLDAHRWRFAHAGPGDGVLSTVDKARQIGICGDWVGGSAKDFGVQTAWRSGTSLAESIIETL